MWVTHPPSLSPSRCLSLRTRRGPSPSHRAAIKGCQHRLLISASGECCEVTAARLAEGTGSGTCPVISASPGTHGVGVGGIWAAGTSCAVAGVPHGRWGQDVTGRSAQ